jgi:hypothetical protein
VASLLALAVSLRQSAPPGEADPDPGLLRRQLKELIALADAAAAGRRSQFDLSLRWEGHFFKGAESETYVPFSVAIEEHSASPRSFNVYVRVMERGPVERAAGARVPWGALSIPPGEMPVGGVAVRHRRSSRYGEASAVLQMLERERQALSPYVFEDAHFVDVEPGDALRPFRLRRALAVPPGEYDLYVVAREGAGPGGRTGVLAERLLVPDLGGPGLRLSSLIVAEHVDALPAPPLRRKQTRRPYAIGSVDITPASASSFDAEDQPLLVFHVYNAALGASHKPAVSVEYRVLRLAAEGDFLPVARLETQQFDVHTLPQEFDADAGHEIGVLTEIPVSALSAGTYRLEVVVTDTLAMHTLIRKVDFEVRPASSLR